MLLVQPFCVVLLCKLSWIALCLTIISRFEMKEQVVICVKNSVRIIASTTAAVVVVLDVGVVVMMIEMLSKIIMIAVTVVVVVMDEFCK